MATKSATDARGAAPAPAMDTLDRVYVGLKKFYYVIGQIGEYILFGLMMLTVVHCLGRYFFKKPVNGLVEISCYLLIIGIFLLISYTQSLKGHIIVDLIYSRWSMRTRALAAIIHYIILLIFTIPAFIWSMKRAAYIRGSGNTSTILGIHYWPILYVVAIGWLLISVISLVQVMIMIRDYRKGSVSVSPTATAAL